MLHVGTNNAKEVTSNEIVDSLLALKHGLEQSLSSSSKVVISSPIQHTDDGKASYAVRKVNEHLRQLDIEIKDNTNINYKD